MALLQINYLSEALRRNVTLNVILPFDGIDYETMSYRTAKDHRFKTLYLLHGLFGDCNDWICGSRIRLWAEEKNLAVVMPSGDNAFYVNSDRGGNDYSTFVGKELVEVTRRIFPLSDKRDDTFIGGLSMGGFGAIRNGIVFSETFSHVIGLSSAIHIFDEGTVLNFGEKAVFGNIKEATLSDANPRVAFKKLLEENRRIPRFYMSCGTRDDLFDANTAFRDFLISNGADVTWDEDDDGHEWTFWDSQIKKAIDWLEL